MQKLQRKVLILLSWKPGKSIIGAAVEKVKVSHFAMALTKELNLLRWLSNLNCQVKHSYVDANARKTHRIAMVNTGNCN